MCVCMCVCARDRPLPRFDPAATASRFITRRFGFTGGLAFVGLLASVEGGEILKALLEVRLITCCSFPPCLTSAPVAPSLCCNATQLLVAEENPCSREILRALARRWFCLQG